jgi:enoyl-CoA hydratase/carnithine racemase
LTTAATALPPDHLERRIAMYKTLEFSIRDRVARVRFTTPESLNSISEDRITDLQAVVRAVREDTTVRALTITGSGRGFCVGLDFDLLKKAFADILYFESVVRRLNAVLLDIEELPVPVIAAVNGYARAGGFELALACDFILIADEAKIGDNHTQVGVMPGGGATQRLPQRIGLQKAKALVFMANWLTGQEAVDYGLALRSVPLAQLDKATEEMLAVLVHRPRSLSAAIKRTMNASRMLDRRTGIEFEISNFVSYMGNEPIAREGYKASLEKRDPSWY